MARPARSLEARLLASGRPRTALRWLGVFTIVGSCTGVGLAWAFREPPLYRAESVLEYAQDPALVARADGPEAGLSADQWYNTQDFLLRSRKLAEAVALQLRLHTDRGLFGVSLRERFDKKPSDAAQRVSEELEVARVPKTRLVKVIVSDTSGRRAASIANKAAEVYLLQSLESRLDSQRRAMAWLADEIEKTSRQLEHAEGELQAYYEKQGSPGLTVEQQQDLLSTEIKNLTQVLTEARVRRIEAAAQVAKLKAAQSENPFEIHTVEVDQNEQVKQLASDYQATFIKFRELTAQGATGPALDAEQSRMQTLTERMRNAIAGVVKSVQGELTAAQIIENQVQSSLDATKRRAQQLQLHQLEYGRIERERRDTAKLLTTLRERSTAIGVSTASGTANARIAELASVPSKPVPRKWPLGATVGFLVGVLLAAAAKRVRRWRVPERYTARV